MGYLTGVVGFKAIFQIFGETGIVTRFILFTDKDVNILEAFHIVTLSLRSSVFVLHCVAYIYSGLPRRSSTRERLGIDSRSGFAQGLRRDSLRSSLRFERRLVEAAGVEPASVKTGKNQIP
jgi:hypothetical protein